MHCLQRQHGSWKMKRVFSRLYKVLLICWSEECLGLYVDQWRALVYRKPTRLLPGTEFPLALLIPLFMPMLTPRRQYYTQDHFQDLVFICLRIKRIHSSSSNCSHGFSLGFRRASDVPVVGYWNRGGTHCRCGSWQSLAASR